jgi:energy-coupling factor transporter transmembrane protein EcfT
MPTNGDSSRTGSRIAIIGAVKTPLGFFALVVLVIEAILGIVAGAISGLDRSITVIGMLVIIIALIGIVAYFSYYRPEALDPKLGNPKRVEIDPTTLTLPLQQEIQRIRKENEELREKVGNLTSLRFRILAMLGEHSGSSEAIIARLGIGGGRVDRREVQSLIGALLDEGRIERDSSSAEHFRIRDTPK